jgi:hypothetical protein
VLIPMPAYVAEEELRPPDPPQPEVAETAALEAPAEGPSSEVATMGGVPAERGGRRCVYGCMGLTRFNCQQRA